MREKAKVEAIKLEHFARSFLLWLKFIWRVTEHRWPPPYFVHWEALSQVSGALTSPVANRSNCGCKKKTYNIATRKFGVTQAHRTVLLCWVHINHLSAVAALSTKFLPASGSYINNILDKSSSNWVATLLPEAICYFTMIVSPGHRPGPASKGGLSSLWRNLLHTIMWIYFNIIKDFRFLVHSKNWSVEFSELNISELISTPKVLF